MKRVQPSGPNLCCELKYTQRPSDTHQEDRWSRIDEEGSELAREGMHAKRAAAGESMTRLTLASRVPRQAGQEKDPRAAPVQHTGQGQCMQ